MKSNSVLASFVMAVFLTSIASLAFATADNISGKRVITDKTDEKSLEGLRQKGCEVLKRSDEVASLICPESVMGTMASGLSLKEDERVYALDLDADKQIGADILWGLNYTGKNRLIAVIDSGIDYTHPELSDSYAGGWNFVSDNNDTYDDDGHGTHVAGIITSNGISANSKGVAPDAKILALKVLDSSGSGYEFDTIMAIYYAVRGPDGTYGTADDFHPDVISLSLGTIKKYTGPNCDYDHDILASAIDYAVARGVAVVASAGNSGAQGVGSPGCISNVITVGAVNSQDQIAQFSSIGDSLDISAPGVNIFSTLPSSYSALSGTSMAAPHISGVIALLKDVNSSANISDIKNAMFLTANDLGSAGWDKYYGYGRVNASQAVNYLLAHPPVPVSQVHDLAITSMSAPAQFFKGSVAHIAVVAKNLGNQAETFNITVFDIPHQVILTLKP